MKIAKYILIPLVLLLVLGGGIAGWAYYNIFRKPLAEQTGWVYLPHHASADSFRQQLEEQTGISASDVWLGMAMTFYKLEERIAANRVVGAYEIKAGATAASVVRQVAYKQQTPVKLSFLGTRKLADIAGRMAQCIEADSVQVYQAMLNPDLLAECCTDSANVGSFFLPDTYQVYWDITPQKLMQRMLSEYHKFWNSERMEKAQALHVTPQQVAVLCSIAEEETANRQERGVVARLYWNRLQKGMLLQADPTVKYAVGDFMLRRILTRHLSTPSPYNTYLNPGLPPGPIRVVEKATIDAFLNSKPHPYLYMCAKEDFSGLHNFATTLTQHNQNAARYHAALNHARIK